MGKGTEIEEIKVEAINTKFNFSNFKCNLIHFVAIYQSANSKQLFDLFLYDKFIFSYKFTTSHRQC